VSPLHGTRAPLAGGLAARLRDACTDVTDDPEVLAASSRDWWPLAMVWAHQGVPLTPPDLVARPRSVPEVSAVLRVCNDARVPVTVAAGRSGVCGGSLPVHGGVVLDVRSLDAVADIDHESLIADVATGVFGRALEDTLRADGLTLGHWPQSVDISTVGGWLACRGAGQLSTRYGKIEDMVVGLDVVLADGTVVHTGGAPRAAVGPDLTQLFVGSEGTLAVITGARLRLHRAPPDDGPRIAYRFGWFDAGIAACRRILQRGATPAVLRLYDAIEAERHFGAGGHPILLVLDEGDAHVTSAVMSIAREECRDADELGEGPVQQWLDHRNDTSALETYITAGYVVDTMEVASSWSELEGIYTDACAAMASVEHTLVASAHVSHAYPDGACLYFTFAGQPPPDEREAYYRAVWDGATRAVLTRGGALSHHHGVGLNRARFVRDALGDAFAVLQSVKDALDPNGILNPGKLGLAGPWGDPAWP
jgi:alkyldihydroxyacetonephosphate synthase